MEMKRLVMSDEVTEVPQFESSKMGTLILMGCQPPQVGSIEGQWRRLKEIEPNA